MVGGGTSLSTKLSVVAMDIFPQSLCRTAWLMHSSPEQSLHIERSSIVHGTFWKWHFVLAIIDDIAFTVNDLSDEYRVALHTIVHHTAIGIDEFKECHIAGTECQRR